jgi:exodeoxyribonuclease VII large subunit
MLQKITSSKATDRILALKKIARMDFDEHQREEIISSVIECLNDNSITVARQAVQTISRLGLTTPPEELKILAHSVQDSKLKTLSIATIRRIELEQKRVETGAIEWNMDEYVFSVGDFLVFINALLSHEIVYIKGEVFDVRVFRDNLVFFSLKDAEGVVNCWFPRAHQYQWGVELSEGIEVVVKVKPQVSPKSGRFGLRVLELKLSGEGSLRLALERLKTKLEAEGLFDESRKRPLPFLPEKIGLITGENSAAYSDFVKVLQARMGGITVHYAPVRVQGVGSIGEICGAIEFFNSTSSPVDLLVLTRGGGSLEDLQSFNSEEVTRAVFSSKIPIVVAVGHEKDWSLAERAADLRASTPSNAAELIVSNRIDLQELCDRCVNSCDQRVRRMVADAKRSVFTSVSAINTAFSRRLQHHYQLFRMLDVHFMSFVRVYEQKRRSFDEMAPRVLYNFEKYYSLKSQRFLELDKLLQSFSPKNVLKRGYSVVKAGGKIVKSADEVKRGDEIEVWPYKGSIKGIVEEVR